MTGHPARWTNQELGTAAATAASQFREQRLAASNAWGTRYHAARQKFEQLFRHSADLNTARMNSDNLADAYTLGLGEALRYLAGPPISDDDLRVIADVESLSPAVLKKDTAALAKVFAVIQRVIDPYRFPWLEAGTPASSAQREAALLASSVLLAAQRMATERRMDGKDGQEDKVKHYLRELGFTEAPPTTITTLVRGPQQGQFCAECQLGERKADVVIRLHDTRLMALECRHRHEGWRCSGRTIFNNSALSSTRPGSASSIGEAAL